MAANATPAILPISNLNLPPITNNCPPPPPPPHPSAILLSSISDTVRFGLACRRPWPELLDRSAFSKPESLSETTFRSAFSKPESLSEATFRFRKNYNYFRINYLVAITAVLAVSLLTNPISLILLIALLAAWIFLYLFRQSSDPPLTAFGRQYSDRETLLFLIVSTVVVIFLTSVGSVLVSALMVGVGIVCLHGAFRTPQDLFLDDQEPQGGVSGFLSFFTTAYSAVAQPPVAVRT